MSLANLPAQGVTCSRIHGGCTWGGTISLDSLFSPPAAVSCAVCQAASGDSARFCRDCGAALNTAAAAGWLTPGPPPHSGGRRRSHARRQPPWLALAAAGAAVVAVAAVIGWQAHWIGDLTAPARPAAAPAASVSPGQPATPPARAATSAPVPRPAGSGGAGASAPPAAAAGPAATVADYFAAISRRDYQRAWQLGGRNSGPAYPEFVAGLAVTASDSISDVSVSGTVVTAFLTAQHTDGSVRTFRGSYTVTAGVITQFDVAPAG